MKKPLKVNVLVTGVGGIIGQGIIKCLRMANRMRKAPVNYRIIGVDSSPLAAGLYFSDLGSIVPKAMDHKYIDSLIKIISDNDISALYIGTDVELDVVSHYKTKIEKRTSAKILICSDEVIRTSRDKWKTFQFLKRKKLPYVESSLPGESSNFIDRFGFPIVVKPREGYGSVHFNIVNDLEHLNEAIRSIERQGWNAIIQEYIPGDDNEYTTGVLSDVKNNSIISSISIKKSIKAGQTYKGIVDNFPDAKQLAENVAQKINARGAINVQTKVKDSSQKIIEINGRLSATCPMRAFAGVNEPDLLYRNVIMHEDSEDLQITSYNKLVSMRYWNEVYVSKNIYQNVISTGLVPKGIENKVFDVQ